MSSNISQVSNTASIIDATFIKMNVVFTDGSNQTSRSLFFSSSHRPETIDGNVYNQLGGLLSVSNIQRDLTSSGADLSVSLTGIDPLYLYFVAGGPATVEIPVSGQANIPVGYYPLFKGSILQMYRGFYDTDYVLSNTYLRYTGLITNYSISQEQDIDNSSEIITISVEASPYRQIFENRIAGRNTNEKSWQYYNPTDTSMKNVSKLVSAHFDFGKKPKTAASSSATNRIPLSQPGEAS